MLRVPRQVLVYLFRESVDGSVEFLLLKRTERWGGFWQGVSGAPEWDETDEQGAIREVFEETGFEVGGSLQALDFRYELLRAEDPDGDGWEQMYGPEIHAVPEEVYVANAPTDTDPTLAPYEHDAFKWCSFKEASELLTWENNRRALKAAREFIAAATASDDLGEDQVMGGQGTQPCGFARLTTVTIGHRGSGKSDPDLTQTQNGGRSTAGPGGGLTSS